MEAGAGVTATTPLGTIMYGPAYPTWSGDTMTSTAWFQSYTTSSHWSIWYKMIVYRNGSRIGWDYVYDDFTQSGNQGLVNTLAVPWTGRPGDVIRVHLEAWWDTDGFADTGDPESAMPQGYYGWHAAEDHTYTVPTVPQKTLTLTFSGTGRGAVTVSPDGRTYDSRDGTQTLTFATGTSVTLIATSENAYWKGFSGAVASSDTTVTVTMDSDKAIDAKFDRIEIEGTAPTIVWNTTPGTVTSGQAYVISVTATDSDNDLNTAIITKTINGGTTTFVESGEGGHATTRTLSNTSTDTGPATITYQATATDVAGRSSTIIQTVAVAVPVTASISATPANITTADTTAISWNSANATSVSVTGPNFTTSSAPSGSQTVGGLAQGAHVYSITAQGHNGPVTDTVTLNVAAPQVTAWITATPDSGAAPGATTISWGSANATSVSVDGPNFTTSAATAGSQVISGLSAGTHIYTITVQGTGGPVTQTATFIVSSVPTVSAAIGTSPSSTTAPGSTAVTWSTSNATSVLVSGPGMTSSTAAGGTEAIAGLPAGTYTYTIAAQGEGGPVTQTATVVVTETPTAAVSASISATPSTAISPGSSTISWSASNATSVSVSGPNFTTSTAESGSRSVTGLAEGTHTYTITAQGAGGPVARTASVTVTAPTVAASISASPSSAIAPGSTTISWATTNATSVLVSGPGMTSSTAPSGTQSVTGLAVGAHTYTIIAQGNGGPVSRSVTVNVGTSTGPVGATITASPETSATQPGSTTVAWSTTNATSVLVSGPGMAASTAASGSTIVSGLGNGSYTYTIIAQGAGGPVTSQANFTVTAGNGRNMAMDIEGRPVPWTGGDLVFSGDSNLAGPGYINIWRRDYAYSQVWVVVDWDEEGNPVYGWRTQATYTGMTFITSLAFDMPADGGQYWATWTAPATADTHGTYYYAEARGSDDFGGFAAGEIGQQAAPSAQVQTVTVAPTAAVAARGAIVNLSAFGGQTGYVWIGATTCNGASATFVVPSTAAGGDTYTVSVYSPPAVVGGTNWAQSNTASATITVMQTTPTITWAAPAPITYGTPLGDAQLNAIANTEGTFAYAPVAGTILPAGAATLGVEFTPADQASWVTAAASVGLTVDKAVLSATAEDKTREFGAANPPLTVSYSGFVNGDTPTALSTQPTAATEATVADPVGSYPITVSGGAGANYTINHVPGTLTITARPVAFSFVGTNQVYDGQPKPVTVTPGVAGASCTVSYQGAGGTTYGPAAVPPTNAGNYTVTATATGNYSGSSSTTLTVAKAIATIAWTPPAPIVYGTALGSDQLDATASVPGSFAYLPPAGAIPPAGLNTLSVEFTPTNPNYGVATASVALVVNKATPAITWAAPAPIAYGTPLGGAQLNASSLVAGSFEYSPAAGTVLNAGDRTLSVTLRPSDAANYTDAMVSVRLTVDKATPVITWGVPAAITYGTALGPAQLNATASVPGSLVYTPAAGAVLNAGDRTLSVAFTPADAQNCESASASVSLVVGKAALTAAADDRTKTYGEPNPMLTISYGGFVNGDTVAAITEPVASTAATTASPAGTYPITLAGGSAANYTLTLIDGTLTVGKAMLSVVADDKTRSYGAANPAFTYGIFGFVNGDTDASVAGSPALSTSATPASDVGVYPIVATIGSLSSPNYDFAFGDGSLTVVPKPVTFAFGDLAHVYDGAPKTATVAPSDPAATFSSDLTRGPDAGAYPVFASAGGNYSGSGSATLAIAAKAVTFAFGNLGHVYDGSVKTATVAPSDPAATYDADVTRGPDAATYTVSATATGNYAGSGAAELVISPAPQTITLSPTGLTVFAGETRTFTASGGHNAYVWGGTAGAVGSGGTVTLTFPGTGGCTVTVSNAAGGNYLASNTVTATVDVISNHQVDSLTPVESSYTVDDAGSPMNGQTYRRIWQEGGWVAYLGRSGVRFNVKAQAWPSVKTLELQGRTPAGEWSQLAVENPANAPTNVDHTFSVMLGDTAPGQPLVPLSFQQGSPDTGEWRFRARVQDADGAWSEFSPEVTVQVVLPVTTKTISGQTVPPAGELGRWFSASPVQNFSFPFWIP